MNPPVRGQPGPVAAGIVLLAGVVSPAMGQRAADPLEFADRWRWSEFTTESGLPSNVVTALAEAPDGTVWVVTTAGPAWFDGFEWHAVPVDSSMVWPQLGVSLTTARGGVAFGSVGSVLYRIERDGVERLDNPARSGRPVYEVATGPDDGLVFMSRGAVFSWHADSVVQIAEPTYSGDPLQLLHTAFERRVLAARESGIYALVGDRWVSRIGPRPDLRLYNLAVESNTGSGLAVITFPPEEVGLWEWSPGTPVRHNEGEDAVGVLAADVRDDDVAIIVYESGAIRIRREGRWRPVEPRPNAMREVSWVRFRENGDLWVGTRLGLHLYRESSMRWSYGPTAFGELNNSVNVILPRADQSLWLGTHRGLELTEPDGTVRAITEAGPLTLRSITALAEDTAGFVWVGSGSAFVGAARWDGRRWSRFGPDEGLHYPVHRIVTARDGAVWFLNLATELGDAAGAYRYDGTRFESWGPERGLNTNRVYDVAVGPDGSLWFATIHGVFRWRDGRWRHWTIADGLVLDRVFSVAVDEDGHVWFTHQLAEGVGAISPTGEVRYVDRPDLRRARGWSVHTAASGRMWVTSRAGLFLKRDSLWSSFDARTGLKHESLWPVLELDEDVLAGSSGGGLIRLSLDELDAPPPRLRVTATVHERRVDVNWNPLAEWGARPSSDVETRYRINAGPWTRWTTERTATFDGLSGRRHRVELQTKGLFATASPPVAVDVVLPPPVWLRPTVFLPGLGLGAAVLGLSIALVRRRRRHLAEERLAQLEIQELNRSLEQRVEERTAQLEAALQELDTFSYSVSHDLKAPIRAIAGFSELLAEELRAVMSPEASRRIGVIKREALRMSVLVDDLLQFSRMGRSALRRRDIELEPVIRDVVQEIRSANPEASFELHLGDLPSVYADPNLLRHVILNLLGNAVKFTAGREAARIEVASREVDHDRVYWVRDNGVGFDAQNASKLFGVFQRLHRQEDYPGSGVGLAIVHRIIDRHGGRVWGDSQPNHGATFFFTVPDGRERES